MKNEMKKYSKPAMLVVALHHQGMLMTLSGERRSYGDAESQEWGEPAGSTREVSNSSAWDQEW